MTFKEMLAISIFTTDNERLEEEAKKVIDFIKLNCLDGEYVVETPLSRETRVYLILKYLIDHVDEI